MLPSAEKFSAVDLYRGRSWPTGGPQPSQKILDGVKPVRELLAPADDRFFLIAGVNQETVTGLRIENGEFTYQVSHEGDGTVPLAFAELSGAKTYYIEASHGSLPNQPLVERGVADLLGTGKTGVLSDQRPFVRAGVRSVRERDMRTPEAPSGVEVSPNELRHLLDGFVSLATPEAKLPVPNSSGVPLPASNRTSYRRIVVGRRRQSRLDINLAHGSITEARARALVLGIFEGVVPSGAAADLDARLGGAIADFTRRRMLSGHAGEIFMMPAARHALRAELIVFAGLGRFDRFDASVLQFVGEHVVRTLAQTGIDDFATVLPGGGIESRPIADSLHDLTAGFVSGLSRIPDGQKIRSITLCERSESRYAQIKKQLYHLLSTPLFDDLEVTLDEIELPEQTPAASGERSCRTPDPAYLIVQQESRMNGTLRFRSSVLGAGEKAAIVSGVREFPAMCLDEALSAIGSKELTIENLGAFGRRLAGEVLAEDVLTLLEHLRDRHLIVVHDAPSSRVPWETLWVGGDSGWFPAAESGLSRKCTAENLSIAKWLDKRRESASLDVLLVVNPTEDLEGADREGERIQALFSGNSAVRVDALRHGAARREAIIDAFRSGRYDVVHFAGHAFFDAAAPGRSGILCSGREVLSGADLTSIGNLPSLVFFNACEAGRIRSSNLERTRPGGQRRGQPAQVQSAGVAEAFLRGGIANYVGTYWPVGDASAGAFASTFYSTLASGRPIGPALLDARLAVRELKSVDWADYMHYGAFDFALKNTSPSKDLPPA
jgi:hypothetical protein